MPNYQKTKRACYMGFITQAIAANFAPLLFLKFHTDYLPWKYCTDLHLLFLYPAAG